MTKIKERIFEDDGKIIVQETHNFHAVTERAKALKSAGRDGLGESKLVGLVPMKLWAEWAKKHGVKPHDTEAMRDVVARELQHRDNSQFRIWEGTF